MFKKTMCFILTAVMLLSAAALAADGIAGDVNGDKAVNNKDVSALFRVCSVSGGIYENARDTNGDGEVNNKDVVLLFRYVSGADVVIYYGKEEIAETHGVTYISVSSPETSLSAGRTMRLLPTVKPDDAENKDVIWSVASGADCGRISADGEFTALKAGKCTITATAADGSGVSGGVEITVTAQASANGVGTKADPYLIKTVFDLVNLKNYISKSGVYFAQAADIDLSGVDFVSVGDDGKPFKNNYDGRNYKISNLAVGAEKRTALFGCAKNASFKNIILENVTPAGDGAQSCAGLVSAAYSTVISGCSVSGEIKTCGDSGLLAGRVYGTFSDKELIVNCSVSGKITGSGENVGGLIGCVDIDYDSLGDEYDYDRFGVVITGCSADVDIEGPASQTGGLIGYVEYGIIKNCRASGDILSSNGNCRGGLIGEVYSASEVSFCYATGDIKSTAEGYGNAMIGGLIGYAFSRCRIHDCYATGSIECAGTYSDCLDNTTYNGGLFIRYRNPCGALIGILHAASRYEPINVYNCYATGTVDVPHASEEELIYCKGSLIGLVYDVATVKLIKPEYRPKYSSPNIVTSLKIDITEDMLDGTMIEKLENNYCVSVFRETYTPQNVIVKNESQTARVGQYTSLPSYKVVTNITADELENEKTFSGFDFENVWRMGDGRPVLRAFDR